MKLIVGLLTGSMIAFGSFVGLLAQEYGVLVEAPVLTRVPQTFTLANSSGNVQYLFNAPDGGVTFAGYGGSTFNHLSDPSVMNDLELVDEQKSKLADVQKKMNEDIAAKTKAIKSTAKKQALEQLTADQKKICRVDW